MLRLVVLLAVSMLACARPPADSTTPERTSRDVITREELRTIQVSSVFDAIQRLRPSMLQVRGRQGQIVVYINGQRAGSVEVLKSLPIADVMSVRRVSGPDATTMHGTGHSAGTIEVTVG